MFNLVSLLVNAGFIVYCLVGSDGNAPLPDGYTNSAPYTGQVFQPGAQPEQTEYTDSFEEEPPLLEGNNNNCKEFWI